MRLSGSSGRRRSNGRSAKLRTSSYVYFSFLLLPRFSHLYSTLLPPHIVPNRLSSSVSLLLPSSCRLRLLPLRSHFPSHQPPPTLTFPLLSSRRVSSSHRKTTSSSSLASGSNKPAQRATTRSMRGRKGRTTTSRICGRRVGRKGTLTRRMETSCEVEREHKVRRRRSDGASPFRPAPLTFCSGEGNCD